MTSSEDVFRATHMAKALGMVEAAMQAGLSLPYEEIRMRDRRIVELLEELERERTISRALRVRLEDAMRRLAEGPTG